MIGVCICIAHARRTILASDVPLGNREGPRPPLWKGFLSRNPKNITWGRRRSFHDRWTVGSAETTVMWWRRSRARCFSRLPARDGPVGPACLICCVYIYSHEPVRWRHMPGLAAWGCGWLVCPSLLAYVRASVLHVVARLDPCSREFCPAAAFGRSLEVVVCPAMVDVGCGGRVCGVWTAIRFRLCVFQRLPLGPDVGWDG